MEKDATNCNTLAALVYAGFSMSFSIVLIDEPVIVNQTKMDNIPPMIKHPPIMPINIPNCPK